jgi:hypothetical protein
MSKVTDLLGQAADCRDLAKRAKRLAGKSRDGTDRSRLTRYVDELGAQALRLEQDAAAAGKAPIF